MQINNATTYTIFFTGSSSPKGTSQMTFLGSALQDETNGLAITYNGQVNFYPFTQIRLVTSEVQAGLVSQVAAQPLGVQSEAQGKEKAKETQPKRKQ